ncbi:Tetratricopeptide region [Trichodesmium erythraeum IMS101]|uniref:Tetratricopeptide region n=1 Tax=Trichodesmium erythraeum (strain IMS101) TaxID=203124 RepID=Q10YU6_TRIEI
MKIIKLLAITLLSFCITVGINILPPTLAESSATHLVQEGTQLLQQGKAEAALEIWQKAEELYRQNQNQTGIIGTKINQAQALTSLGFYGRSCNTVLQAFGNDLECARLTENDLENVLEKFQTSNTSLNFQGLQILGNGLLAFGKLELSEKVLEASYKWVNSNNTKAQLLISLGNNRLSQAQNIAVDRRSGKDERALRTLVDQSLSNYQEAASISTDKSVQIQGTINNLSLLVKFTKEIGDLDTYVQFQIETLPEIIDFLNQINPTPKSIRARIKLAEIFTNIEEIKDQSAFVEFQTNITKLTPPSELLNQAIEEAKDINNFRLEAYGLSTKAKLNLKKGNLEEALKLTNKALLTAQKVSAYDIVYQLQEQLGDIFIKQGNYSEALLADKSAFNTLQVLRQDLVALNRNIQFNFRDSIEPLYRKLLDLLLQPELGSNQPNVENIKVAVEVIESLQLAELDNFFQDACVNAQDINIDEIDENVAVIYPILFKDRLSVILKLPGTDSFRYATVSENDFQAKFEKNLLGLRVNITSLKRKPRLIGEVKFQSNQLYNWLIKPFEGYLEIDLKDDASQIKTLVFVLEGNLRNIPMSVLYDSKRERYLVERYAIAVAPSLELLPPKPLLKQQIRVLTTGTDKEAPSYRQRGYDDLPNVKQELESINKTAPQSEALVDEKFTEINISDKINSESFNIVHIATHGQFSSNSDQTFILAWDKPINVKDFDQLLQSENLQRSQRAIELLILSACQTAFGDQRAALGLAGVAVRAGARSVLGSLWRVDDASTAELMKQFYQQLFQSNTLQLKKAEALRQVQIKFIKGEIETNSEEYKKPYYWSPFIMVGNWL